MAKDLEGTLDAGMLREAVFLFGPLFGKIKNGRYRPRRQYPATIAADYISAPRPQTIPSWVTPERQTRVRLAVAADAGS